MALKWFFDRAMALLGLLCLWPVLVIVAIMIKVKMPGGPVFSSKSELVKMENSLTVTSSAQ